MLTWARGLSAAGRRGPGVSPIVPAESGGSCEDRGVTDQHRAAREPGGETRRRSDWHPGPRQTTRIARPLY